MNLTPQMQAIDDDASDRERANRVRRWAQYINDDTQPAPSWIGDLLRHMEAHTHGSEPMPLAFQIIEDFPVSGRDSEVDRYISDRVAEESLLSFAELVKWLYADTNRADVLARSYHVENPPLSLLEALRLAYADDLKDTIATLEVYLENCGEVPALVFPEDE